MDAAAVAEKIADRDCAEHPVLDAVLLKDFLIGDVVGEAIVCVAFDFDAEDDAAIAYLGNGWRTPTFKDFKDFKELREKCTWTWTLLIITRTRL